jgi:tetratricopeptide (TPR) repeat protein
MVSPLGDDLEFVLELRPMLRLLLAIALIMSGALAEDMPTRVEPDVAQQQLVKKVEAVTPPIASLAGVGGTVALDVVISADGKVSSTTVLSGPPLLLTACIEAVKQWEYKPFVENGRAITVVTKVECDMRAANYTSSEEKALKDYYPADEACVELYRARNYPDAETKCSETVALAELLPRDRMIERSRSYAYLANTLLSDGKLGDAIPFYQKALEAYRGVEHSERNADFATAHANLAHAYFLNRQFDEADPLYGRAIQIYEGAIAVLPNMKDIYTARMKKAILEYAKLKETEGDAEAAETLEQKAAALP